MNTVIAFTWNVLYYLGRFTLAHHRNNWSTKSERLLQTSFQQDAFLQPIIIGRSQVLTKHLQLFIVAGSLQPNIINGQTCCY